MERIAGKDMVAQSSRVPLQWRAGFTLTELMVVLSITLVLLTIGVPGFGDLIASQKVAIAANDFFMAINLTRAEAVRRGVRVDLVPLRGADWTKGWAVFVDRNGNQVVDAGEEVIYSHGALSKNLSVTSNLSDSSKAYLAYIGSGRSRTNSSAQMPQFGTISFTMNKKIRRIKLNFIGRPRLCNPEGDNTCTGATDS